MGGKGREKRKGKKGEEPLPQKKAGEFPVVGSENSTKQNKKLWTEKKNIFEPSIFYFYMPQITSEVAKVHCHLLSPLNIKHTHIFYFIYIGKKFINFTDEGTEDYRGDKTDSYSHKA